jgi:hypothetical protein
MTNHQGTIVGVTVVCLCTATLIGRAAPSGSDGIQAGTQQSQPAGPPPGPPPGPRGPGGPGGPGMGGPMGPFGGGFGMGMPGSAEVVTGAPYSAQAVTEITQSLGDGNRIVRKVTASVYRDSSGRVRRDQVLAAVGSWMPNEQPKTAIIDDPVAHFHYILNPDRQTAARFPAPDASKFKRPPSSSANGANPPNDPPRHRGPGTMEKTSLGTQTIEGVQATGTKSVLTIEAGAIGNDQAIQIVSEEWYSPDLKTVVLSKKSDPRFGDVIYSLTQINRNEPDPTLFQVPSNFTVTDGGRGQHFGPGGPRQNRRQPPPPPQDEQEF